jgi:hypothetical protein
LISFFVNSELSKNKVFEITVVNLSRISSCQW